MVWNEAVLVGALSPRAPVPRHRGVAAVPGAVHGRSAVQLAQGHHRHKYLYQRVLSENPRVAVASPIRIIYNFHGRSSVANEKLNFPSGAEAWPMSHCTSLANLRSAANYSVTADTKWAEKMLILSG